jgi:pyruvate/2-oxoglutarate dehydrogenase complex dihydrolipoamide dehydrogenase (E3) component
VGDESYLLREVDEIIVATGALPVIPKIPVSKIQKLLRLPMHIFILKKSVQNDIEHDKTSL